eukprot:1183969-Prorocentrum_minimum.AAC.1
MWKTLRGITRVWCDDVFVGLCEGVAVKSRADLKKLAPQVAGQQGRVMRWRDVVVPSSWRAVWRWVQQWWLPKEEGLLPAGRYSGVDEPALKVPQQYGSVECPAANSRRYHIGTGIAVTSSAHPRRSPLFVISGIGVVETTRGHLVLLLLVKLVVASAQHGRQLAFSLLWAEVPELCGGVPLPQHRRRRDHKKGCPHGQPDHEPFVRPVLLVLHVLVLGAASRLLGFCGYGFARGPASLQLLPAGLDVLVLPHPSSHHHIITSSHRQGREYA